MNDGCIHVAFVHQNDGLLRGEVSYLPMRLIARQAAPPEMDLRIDDLHQPVLLLRPAPVGCSVLFGMADLTIDDRRTHPREVTQNRGR